MADPRRDSAVDLLEVKYNMFLTEANVLVFYGQNRS